MTGRISARALAGACLLATATLAVPAAGQGSSTVLGGYRPVATDNEIVQEVAGILAAHIGGTLASVDAATHGALAYRLEITLEDGARWSGTVVVRPPGRNFAVSGEPVQLQPPPGEGDEVDTGSNQAPEDEG
jgi:hypothetical protein